MMGEDNGRGREGHSLAVSIDGIEIIKSQL